MLDNVRIVLVNTSDCRNMGSAARAMKTMGLKNLVLVDPKEMPNGQAQALAAGATDVLANAKVVATMKEAIEDCGLVVGTSARSRTLPWPMLDPRSCGKQMSEEGKEYPVALVFGRESSGLTNDELQLCHYHVAIPANPEYSSLNLAMAVQTLSYEIRMNFLEAEQAQFEKQEVSSDSADAELQDGESKYQLVEETERFYDHFESAMQKTGFIQAKHPGIIMTKVRRLFNRARPDGKELKMLRGILASIDKSVKNKD
ncbi:tRNA (cytosine(32)/uridine(32)-2'-O)-methyltransferase TrmJ [Thalassotalea nanhaiensis]|uniref:tRNA (cytidine/uridine-2'-O-)-methyltransferase TrmJ n=1 Tax=Thalassotalea nanhaiensis TaxID=3065648 RepID=A0ABY9TKY2_9GAMM|nr:tRNA (cytosine(32)/uridine(32)-2'-O)-methyltransferase TrmJ [Colwelliaceae bacterium SQ345]